MENFIQVINNGYTVKISLQNIDYENVGNLLKEIMDDTCWHWNSFYTHDKLWYCDGGKFLTCEAVNYDAKVIIFA